MQIIVNKCVRCGMLFENQMEYEQHRLMENELWRLRYIEFPEVEDAHFTCGGVAMERSVEWLDAYKIHVASIVKEYTDNNYEPWSYAWFRYLDDSNSKLYKVACRVNNVCPICYKEWGQSYYAIHCNHLIPLRKT